MDPIRQRPATIREQAEALHWALARREDLRKSLAARPTDTQLAAWLAETEAEVESRTRNLLARLDAEEAR